MEIVHNLFWIRNKRITSLLCKEGKLEILKIGGRKSLPLTESYRSEWEECAGMCSGDKTDICLIFDEKPETAESLMSKQCESKDCFWCRAKIEKALELLEIKEPTEIRDEKGALLAKAGRFMHIRKEDIIQMTALYTKAEKDAENDDTSTAETTPLIRHYHDKLKAYKKGDEI